MSQLTVFMPSYRGFRSSFSAIETALDYCLARNALLIVADNSQDREKRDYWHSRSDHLLLLDTSGMDGKSNFLAAMRAVKTPFLLAMGDDDELRLDRSHKAPDLSQLPEDCIGVRPKTEVWTHNYGVLRTKTFAISGAIPSERMAEYNRFADGDNGAYYSIFRREPYQKLMNFFFAHHPTSGGYGDWAMVLSLFAAGKMAYDPGTIYGYNFDQWHGAGASETRSDSLYQLAGLPDGSRKYHYLLMFLDIFVYCCPGFLLSGPDQSADAMQMASGPFLDAFLKRVGTTPEEFAPEIHRLCYQAQGQSYVMDRFMTGLDMAECIQSGLKNRYIQFFNVAMGDTN